MPRVGSSCSIAICRAARRSAAKTSTPDDVVRTLFAATTFDQVVISPDGKQVAWVENVKGGSAVYAAEISAPKPRRITAGGSI